MRWCITVLVISPEPSDVAAVEAERERSMRICEFKELLKEASYQRLVFENQCAESHRESAVIINDLALLLDSPSASDGYVATPSTSLAVSKNQPWLESIEAL